MADESQKIGLDAFLGMREFDAAVSSYLGSIAKMNSATDSAAGAMSSGFSAVSTQSLILAEVVGNLLYNAILKLVSVLRGLVGESLNVVSEYERLALSLETLVAREILNAKAADDMTQALEKASDPARELIKWVTLLAIKSPFDQAGVAAALQTAVAYGFVTQAAKDVADAQEKGIVTAQRLTEALINWAAGAGKTTAEMGRATYALGQMKAAGRVMRQDLMQLTTAGVPVNDILQEMGVNFANVTKEAIRSDEFILKFVERLEKDFGNAAERQADTISGLLNSLGDLRKLLIREFFGPINEETGKMMGVLGAIKPLLSDFVNTFTNEAVLNNVRALGVLVGDYLSVGVERLRSAISGTNAGFNSFKSILYDMIPALTSIVGVGGILVGTLISINAVAGLLRTGIAVATTAFSVLASTVTFLISPLGLVSAAIVALIAIFASTAGKIRQDVNVQFGQIADDSYFWGTNIVNSLATGMINAVVAIIDALAYIGSIIAGWLAPGSPPKLLPKLDKWGAAAMTEYVKAFAKADFSTFDEISSIMTRFFRSLSEGQLARSDVIPTILKSRKELAKLIENVRETGEVTESALNKAFKAFGPVTDEFKGYIRLSLQMEAATKKVEDAQRELNAVTSFYDDLLDSLHSQLRGVQEDYDDNKRLAQIQEAINTGLLTDSERERLENEKKAIQLKREIRLVEQRRDAAVDAAKDNVSNAVKEQDAIAEQIALQKSIIDVQIEQNSLIKEQIQLLEALAKQKEAAAAGGAATAPEAKPLDPLGIVPSAGTIGKSIDEIKKTFTDKLAGIVSVFKPIGEAWDRLGNAWAPVIEMLTSRFRLLFDKGINPFIRIRRFLRSFIPEEYWDDIDRAVEIFRDWLENKIPKAIETATKWWNDTFLPALSKVWTFLEQYIFPALGTLFDWLVKYGPTIALFVAGFLGAIKVFGIIYNAVVLVTGVIASLAPVIETVAAIIIAVTSPIGLVIVGIAAAVGLLAAAWINNWGGIQEKTREVIDFIVPFIADAIKGIVTFVGKLLDKLRDWWGKHGDSVMKVVKGLWNFVKGQFNDNLNFIKGIIELAIRTWERFWKLHGEWLMEIWENSWNAVKDFFKNALTAIGNLFDLFSLAFQGDWEGFGEKLREIVDDMWEGIKASFDLAFKNIKIAFAGVIEAVKKLFTDTDWRSIGSNIVQAIANGITGSVQWIRNAINSIKDIIIGIIKGFIGLGGGTTAPSPRPPTGRASGGFTPAGETLVGEEGPELVTLNKPSYITPTDELVKAVMKSIMTRFFPTRSVSPNNVTNNITNNTYLSINPSYSQVQSPAGIYYDVTAALAVSARL